MDVSGDLLGAVKNPSASLADQWRELIPDTATVARQHYRLASVKCDMPLLMLPLEGTKQLHFAGATFSCQPGEYLMLHAAIAVGVENIPAADQPYRAWIIGFSWRLIELARQLILGGEVAAKKSNQPISKQPLSARLHDALHRYLQRLHAAASTTEIDLCLIDILVALHGDGDAGFLRASDPSLAARIRTMVSAQPQRDWISADFEAALYLSGATLRRRLAEEETSLRALVREARLHVALTLLQTTRYPVKTVAAQSGYRSLASFRENFIEQFGVAPATVANS